MIKRIKSRRERRRFGSGESSPGAGYHSRRLFAKARRRRRSLRVLVVLLVSLAGALLAVGYASSGTAGVGDYLSAISGSEYSTAVWEEEPADGAGGLFGRLGRRARRLRRDRPGARPGAGGHLAGGGRLPGRGLRDPGDGRRDRPGRLPE